MKKKEVKKPLFDFGIKRSGYVRLSSKSLLGLQNLAPSPTMISVWRALTNGRNLEHDGCVNSDTSQCKGTIFACGARVFGARLRILVPVCQSCYNHFITKSDLMLSKPGALGHFYTRRIIEVVSGHKYDRGELSSMEIQNLHTHSKIAGQDYENSLSRVSSISRFHMVMDHSNRQQQIAFKLKTAMLADCELRGQKPEFQDWEIDFLTDKQTAILGQI